MTARYARAFTAGTLLSATVCGLYGSLGPETPVRLTASPWHDWLALGAAPGVSPLTTFAWSAVMLTACFFITARRQARKALVAEPEPAQLEEAQPCS